jgi:hypothetical protein
MINDRGATLGQSFCLAVIDHCYLTCGTAIKVWLSTSIIQLDHVTNDHLCVCRKVPTQVRSTCRLGVDRVHFAPEDGLFDKVKLAHRHQRLLVANVQERIEFCLDARQERDSSAVASCSLRAWGESVARRPTFNHHRNRQSAVGRRSSTDIKIRCGGESSVAQKPIRHFPLQQGKRCKTIRTVDGTFREWINRRNRVRIVERFTERSTRIRARISSRYFRNTRHHRRNRVVRFIR